jgi:hypothetical protein
MKTILITIATGMLIAAFGWWLNQDRYQVKYTLSEQIPLGFGAAQQEAVQQLEVKNLGRKAAEAVQVKIPSTVSEFQILKNSEADDVKTFKSQNGFELVYGSLPTQGSFRLVFKTSGIGVSKKEILVRHSKGSAEEALSAESSFPWAGVLTPLFYMVLIVYWLRGMGVDSWERDAKYKSEKVLRASKPFYVANEKWREIRKEAIDEFGRSQEFRYGEITETEIATWPIHRWLNEDMPKCLSDEEWLQFRAAKTKQFLALMKRRLNESWMKPSEILSLLKLSRPRQVPAEQWTLLQNDLRAKYVALRADEIGRDLANGAHVSMPEDVDRQLWSLVEAKVGTIRFQRLSHDLEFGRAPIDFLQRQNLSMLTAEQQAQLEGRAYKLQLEGLPKMMNESDARKFLQTAKPAWILEADYARVKEMAERVVTIADEGRRNTIVESSLKGILFGVELSKKDIESLDERSKQGLRDLDQRIRTTSEKNARDATSNAEEAGQIARMKATILRQLEVIERVFADPSSLERIEPYDNPFAVGNFEMLKQVAKLLSRNT